MGRCPLVEGRCPPVGGRSPLVGGRELPHPAGKGCKGRGPMAGQGAVYA